MASFVSILSILRPDSSVARRTEDRRSIEDIQREALLRPCEPFPCDELPGFLLGLIATTGFVFLLPFIFTAIIAGMH